MIEENIKIKTKGDLDNYFKKEFIKLCIKVEKENL